MVEADFKVKEGKRKFEKKQKKILEGKVIKDDGKSWRSAKYFDECR